ncbi:hypothetical protein [Azospirillum sp. TSH58]|uniref:hypothetical protein n=1 Tax=Azospirillum sp. TSH58 TaxID=664962 RepID=UPI0011B28967|nr:hypothetical protein [Azospirillum sp. TSH58]
MTAPANHGPVNGEAMPAGRRRAAIIDPETQATYRLWMELVRVARDIGGRDAARRVWEQSPLPRLDRCPAERDWIGSFLAEVTEPSPGSRLQAEALWQAYLDWCSPRGVDPFTRKRFLQLVAERLRRQKASTIHFLNIRLRVR